MCVSSEPADFDNTSLLIAQARHPETGRTVHVLGYQNRAVNFASGPNAMVLHFPAQVMTQANVVDTSSFPWFMQDVVDAVKPRMRGGDRGFSLSVGKGVEIFEHGIYTIVLTSNASLVADALPLVPEHKRPRLNRILFDWYGSTWPNWPLALCCFNNSQAIDADPMLWWYEPLDQSRFMAPAVDCHTGGVPNLRGDVDVDHWVVGGTKVKRSGMSQVFYRDEKAIPSFARALLPDYVVGRKFEGRMRNGDFFLPADNLSTGAIQRGFLQ